MSLKECGAEFGGETACEVSESPHECDLAIAHDGDHKCGYCGDTSPKEDWEIE